jgi:hypothetical protein
MFSKRKSIDYKFSDAIELMDNDENRIDFLKDRGVLRANGEFLELDDQFLDFFEQILDVNEEINLSYIDENIKNIKENIISLGNTFVYKYKFKDFLSNKIEFVNE